MGYVAMSIAKTGLKGCQCVEISDWLLPLQNHIPAMASACRLLSHHTICWRY